jgi:hypothetical protein
VITDERLALRGMSIVQDLLHKASHLADAPRPLEGLLSAARASGMSLSDLARATRLGEVVVRKLDRRLIRFASIPSQAIDAVANAVRCQARVVALYLEQPPAFAPRAHYRAERVPRLSEPEDFIVAVENDPTMAPEDHQRWRDVVAADPS